MPEQVSLRSGLQQQPIQGGILATHRFQDCVSHTQHRTWTSQLAHSARHSCIMCTYYQLLVVGYLRGGGAPTSTFKKSAGTVPTAEMSSKQPFATVLFCFRSLHVMRNVSFYMSDPLLDKKHSVRRGYPHISS